MSEEFRQAMMAERIIPPDNLLADGKIHRCKVDGHKTRSGAYQLFPDGLGGGFQNWTVGGWKKWTSSERDKLTPDERSKMAALVADVSRKREAERAA